jgi:hypothetical protein
LKLWNRHRFILFEKNEFAKPSLDDSILAHDLDNIEIDAVGATLGMPFERCAPLSGSLKEQDPLQIIDAQSRQLYTP